jgi:hypothetical protein
VPLPSRASCWIEKGDEQFGKGLARRTSREAPEAHRKAVYDSLVRDLVFRVCLTGAEKFHVCQSSRRSWRHCDAHPHSESMWLLTKVENDRQAKREDSPRHSRILRVSSGDSMFRTQCCLPLLQKLAPVQHYIERR